MDKVVEEYEDNFTSPTGVPLHCQVKHSINLTPGVSLPNGPIYRHSVLANDEIKRQIQEFITLWEPDHVGTEEGWDLETLY